MDEVYMISNRRWISQPICIREYFKTYQCKVENAKYFTNERQKNRMKSLMTIMDTSLPEQDFLEIENYCCSQKLDIPNEPGSLHADSTKVKRELFEVYRVPEGEECKLKTLQKVRNAEDKGGRSNWKYTSAIQLNSTDIEKPDLKPNQHIVLVLKVYQPFTYTLGIRNPKALHCMYEIAVLGCQTLAEFRDKIECTSDMSVKGESSENPDEVVSQTAKDVYKSGFLFFEGVFYNDFRDQNNIDYSEVIRKWAKEKKLGPFTCGDMAKTKFEDLTVRFGYPYVYQHQGKCEHLVVFSDARLLHNRDPLSLCSYPFYVSLGARKGRYCLVCNLYVARWVTYGNQLVTIDPCYFCEKCFRSCNYVNGKKIGEFTAYKFYDIACVL